MRSLHMTIPSPPQPLDPVLEYLVHSELEIEINRRISGLANPDSVVKV